MRTVAEHKPLGIPVTGHDEIAQGDPGVVGRASQQLDVRVNMQDTSQWYSNRRVNESCAMFKTIVENGSDRILGAHLLGPHADEVINLFGLAIRHGLTADDLKQTILAYPTGASDIGYML